MYDEILFREIYIEFFLMCASHCNFEDAVLKGLINDDVASRFCLCMIFVLDHYSALLEDVGELSAYLIASIIILVHNHFFFV